MLKPRIVLVSALVVVLTLAVAATVFAADTRNFRAHLSSGEEVTSVPIDSLAQGQAVFQLSQDGTELNYQLNAADVEDVTQAHIHTGISGVNGPVVVWLYPSAPPAVLIPGLTNGVLAEGTIDEFDLVGPLAGQPLSLLIDLLKSGAAYVNVHTSEYPTGEIRGQVK